MPHNKARPRSSNKRIFRFKAHGHLFGAWYWTRDSHSPGVVHPIADGGSGFERAGMVIRIGPLGHLQFSWKEKRWDNGRRNLRTFGIHVWGISGRRRKRGAEIGVFW